VSSRPRPGGAGPRPHTTTPQPGQCAHASTRSRQFASDAVNHAAATSEMSVAASNSRRSAACRARAARFRHACEQYVRPAVASAGSRDRHTAHRRLPSTPLDIPAGTGHATALQALALPLTGRR
jgi:hypothetical protein